MCIAIYKPEGKIITKKALCNSFVNNEDGAGFAYPENGKVVIKKGFFSFKAFWKEYRDYQNRTCIIHFRKANKGTISTFNCHPWEVNESVAFIHNGTIPIALHDKDVSDTGNFAKYIARPLYDTYQKNFFKFKHVEWLLAHSIGNSKLIFLHAHGDYLIVNEHMGHWHDGVWYSNDSYKEKKIFTTSYYKGGSSFNNNRYDNEYSNWWKQNLQQKSEVISGDRLMLENSNLKQSVETKNLTQFEKIKSQWDRAVIIKID